MPMTETLVFSVDEDIESAKYLTSLRGKIVENVRTFKHLWPHDIQHQQLK